MDSRKLKTLVNFINAINVGPCIESLKQLRDGCHFMEMLRIIDEAHAVPDCELPIQRYNNVLSFLEDFYNSPLKFHIDCSAIVNHGSESEICKVVALLMCAAVQGQEEKVKLFVEPITELDLQSQTDLKDIIVFITMEEKENKLRPNFADVLRRKGSSCSACFRRGEMSSLERESTSSGSSTPLDPTSPFQQRTFFQNSPLSPVKMLLTSPHMTNKINMRKMHQKIRKLETDLNTERALKEDLEAILQDKNKEIQQSESKCRGLNQRVTELKKLQDQVDELNSVKVDLKRAEQEIYKLRSKLGTVSDYKSENVRLGKDLQESLTQIEQLKARLTNQLELKAANERLQLQLNRAEIKTCELRTSQEHLKTDLHIASQKHLDAEQRLEQSQDMFKERIEELEEKLAKGSTPGDEGESLGIIAEKRISDLEIELQMLRSSWIEPRVHHALQENFKEVCQKKEKTINELEMQVKMLHSTWIEPQVHTALQESYEDVCQSKEKTIGELRMEIEGLRSSWIEPNIHQALQDEFREDSQWKERMISDLEKKLQGIRSSWIEPQVHQALQEEYKATCQTKEGKIVDLETELDQMRSSWIAPHVHESLQENFIQVCRAKEGSINELQGEMEMLRSTWIDPRVHQALKEESNEACELKDNQIAELKMEMENLQSSWIEPQVYQALEENYKEVCQIKEQHELKDEQHTKDKQQLEITKGNLATQLSQAERINSDLHATYQQVKSNLDVTSQKQKDTELRLEKSQTMFKEKIVDLQERLTQSSNCVEQVESMKKAAEKKIRELEGELHNVRCTWTEPLVHQALQENYNDVSEMKDELELKDQQLLRDHQQLKSVNEDLVMQLSQARKTVSDLQAAQQQVKSNLDATSQKQKDTELRLEKSQIMFKEKIEDLEEKLTKCSQCLEETETLKTSGEKKIGELETQLQSLQSKWIEPHVHQALQENYEEVCRTKEERTSHLKKELQELRLSWIQPEIHQSFQDNFKAVCQNKEKKIGDLEAELERLRSSWVEPRLHQILQENYKEVCQSKEQLQLKEKLLLQDQQELKSTKEKLHTQLRQAETAISELQMVQQQQKMDLDAMSQKHKDAEQRLQQSQDMFKGRIEDLQEKLTKSSHSGLEGESLRLNTEKKFIELEMELQGLRSSWIQPEVHEMLQENYKEVFQIKEKRISDLEREVQELRSSWIEPHVHQAVQDNNKEVCQMKEKKVNDLEAELQGVRSSWVEPHVHQSLQENYKEVCQIKETLESMTVLHKKNLDNLNSEIGTQLQTLKDQFSQEKEKLLQENRSLEKEKLEAIEEIDNLKFACDNHEQEVESLRMKQLEAEHETASVREECVALKGEFVRREETFKEYETAMKNQMQDLTDKYESSMNRSKELEYEIESRVTTVQEDAQTKSLLLVENENLRAADRHTFAEEKAVMHKKIQELVELNNRVKLSGKQQLQTKEAEIQKLKQQLEEEIEGVRERYEQEIDSLSRKEATKHDLLHQELDIVRMELEHTNSLLATEMEAHKEKAKLIESVTESMTSSKTEKDKQVASLKISHAKEINGYETKVEKLQKELLTLKTETGSLRRRMEMEALEKIQEARNSLEEEKRSLHSKIENLQQAKSQLEVQVQQLQNNKAMQALDLNQSFQEMFQSDLASQGKPVSPKMNHTLEQSIADSLNGSHASSRYSTPNSSKLELDDLNTGVETRSKSRSSIGSTCSSASTRSKGRTRIEITLSHTELTATPTTTTPYNLRRMSGRSVPDFPDSVERTLDELCHSQHSLTASVQSQKRHHTTGRANFVIMNDCAEEPEFFDWEDRIKELHRRNTLCPVHMRTSYPVETQTVGLDDFKENELKTIKETTFSESGESTKTTTVTRQPVVNTRKRKSEMFLVENAPTGKHLRKTVSHETLMEADSSQCNLHKAASTNLMPPPSMPRIRESTSQNLPVPNRNENNRFKRVVESRIGGMDNKYTSMIRSVKEKDEIKPDKSVAFDIPFSPKLSLRRRSMRHILGKKSVNVGSPKVAPEQVSKSKIKQETVKSDVKKDLKQKLKEKEPKLKDKSSQSKTSKGVKTTTASKATGVMKVPHSPKKKDATKVKTATGKQSMVSSSQVQQKKEKRRSIGKWLGK